MYAVGAVLDAELRLGQVSWVLAMSGQRWLVQRGLPNELVVLDEQLTPVWRLRLPAGRFGRAAVAEDLSLVGLSRGGQVLVLDGTGRQLASFPDVRSGEPSSGWTGSVFTADGRQLWAILPAPASASSRAAAQELWLIDMVTRLMVDRRRLEVDANDGELFRHPDGQTIGLLLWADDGAAIGWACADRGRIDLRVAPWRDRVLLDVHPAGAEYLTLPYGGGHELLRHRLRDDQPIGVLAASAVAGEAEWDYQAGYLTSDLILAGADSGQHLLIGTTPMRLLAAVAYHDRREGGLLFPSGQGTWLTLSGPSIRRWRPPAAPGEQLQLPLS